MASPSSLTITDNTGTTGEVQIDWLASDGPKDAQFWSYRLYVREQGVLDWILAYETWDDIASYTYDLYQFPANVTVEVAVVEVTNNPINGLAEGAYNIDTFITSGISGYYMIDPADSTNNFYLEWVTDDPASEEWETAEMTLLGRGRKVDLGTSLGIKGSLSVAVIPTTTRTVREQWNEIKGLRQTGFNPIFVRTPFGDLMKIVVTSVSRSRVGGVGLDDYMNVTINYTGVA